MHTTGYAFDIERVYSNGRQVAAFQFVLDRLQAVNAIAYIRETAAIHIAVAADAEAKLALLDRLVEDQVNVRMWNSSTSRPFSVSRAIFAIPSLSSKRSRSSSPTSSTASS